MRVTGDTHIGLVRTSNQDALDYGTLDGGQLYAVVCDGMGGANGGNIASGIAVRMISQRIKSGFSDGQVPHSIEYLLASAMAAANIEIYDQAQADATLEGMGTTVVTAVVCDRTAYISHAGDSRVYLYRKKSIQPVTRDHSVVQEMIESGQITEEQARSHPRKHFITRALGVLTEENGEYDEVPLQEGDRLLLCTDGLTNMVDAPTIAGILAASSGDVAVQMLIDAAIKGGGTDNITAVVIDCDGIQN